MKNNLLLFILLFVICSVPAQQTILLDQDNAVLPSTRSISFVKNLGQWNDEVAFKASIGGMNTLYLEQKGFTYVFTNPQETEQIHDALHEEGMDFPMRFHAYKVEFRNSKTSTFLEKNQEARFNNYFIGNDKKKWASKVPVYNTIGYDNLYEGIDLEVYSFNGNLKYDFKIAPGTNPQNIELIYHGVNSLSIDEGNLIVETSVVNVIESIPFAYQVINNEKVEVLCEYRLNGTIVSYHFPNGYDVSKELIIDPVVVAATLSGMTETYNFGQVATYDSEGNIFSGGRSYGIGYPTTIGAFQEIFGGGVSDIAITKFNAEGTEQIYATYLGGSDEDIPFSIVADVSDNLYILGSTMSSNYPTFDWAFQPEYDSKGEILISKLSADGSSLFGSTYVGGSEEDGKNNVNNTNNYDDHLRSEIIIDRWGNPYVISNTSSPDFPVTTEAYDTSYNSIIPSSQDVVVFKMNSNLSAMSWATFLGGEGEDSGFGIRVDDIGKVYVTGVARDSVFPTTAGVVQEAWPGGNENAFVAVFDATGSELIASTFWGNGENTQSFFLDLDESNQVHILGQSYGQMPITPGAYFYNEESRQFLSAFSEDLSELIYSTVIGAEFISTFGFDFAPVAFGIDKCGYIYFSGYYASIGMPVTADAFDTEGGSFYIGVLEPMAAGLHFGTYYGDADHVDGGMSRFDKYGNLYQGICSCLNGMKVLNTLPGSFAEEQTTFCEIGVFKVDFETFMVESVAHAEPGLSGNAPFEVSFQSSLQNESEFFWDFDDNGAVSSEANPVYTFENQGIYEVKLVASNSATCNIADTSYLIIKAIDPTSTFQITDNFEIWLEPNLTQKNNPTNLFVKGKYTGKINYSILDSRGYLISENSFFKNGAEGNHSFKTPSAAGVYLIYLTDEQNGFIKTLKLIVQ